MKIKVKVGNQNKIKLNQNVAREFEVKDNDVFDMQFSENQILLTKISEQEQPEQTE